jgi:hypothetical protein
LQVAHLARITQQVAEGCVDEVLVFHKCLPSRHARDPHVVSCVGLLCQHPTEQIASVRGATHSYSSSNLTIATPRRRQGLGTRLARFGRSSARDCRCAR